VFFLGLLSTPLPYLLLAAFYFFGFAMGMFNNNTGDETSETIVAVSIPAEIKPATTPENTYYYQSSPENFNVQADQTNKNSASFNYFPDTGIKNFTDYTSEIIDSQFSAYIFSRPPPLSC